MNNIDYFNFSAHCDVKEISKNACLHTIQYYILRFIVEVETFSVDVRLLPRDSEQHKMAFTSVLNLFPETN